MWRAVCGDFLKAAHRKPQAIFDYEHSRRIETE
jgi:hypothetical protein